MELLVSDRPIRTDKRGMAVLRVDSKSLVKSLKQYNCVSPKTQRIRLPSLEECLMMYGVNIGRAERYYRLGKYSVCRYTVDANDDVWCHEEYSSLRLTNIETIPPYTKEEELRDRERVALTQLYDEMNDYDMFMG